MQDGRGGAHQPVPRGGNWIFRCGNFNAALVKLKFIRWSLLMLISDCTMKAPLGGNSITFCSELFLTSITCTTQIVTHESTHIQLYNSYRVGRYRCTWICVHNKGAVRVPKPEWAVSAFIYILPQQNSTWKTSPASVPNQFALFKMNSVSCVQDSAQSVLFSERGSTECQHLR